MPSVFCQVCHDYPYISDSELKEIVQKSDDRLVAIYCGHTEKEINEKFGKENKMKKQLYANGKKLESLDQLVGGEQITTHCVYDESDLPEQNEATSSFSHHDVMLIVRALMSIGKKIPAIKFVRQVTEWGLRESKEFVENTKY